MSLFNDSTYISYCQEAFIKKEKHPEEQKGHPESS